MPYSKTTWTDEVPSETPIKYKITDDSNGVIANSAKIEIVTPVTAGTPINATNLNKHEDAIYAAVAAAEAAEATAAEAEATAQALYAIHKRQAMQAQIVYDTSDVQTSTVFYFFVPATMNGMNLVRATAFVAYAGTTGATTLQVRNTTKYPSSDALSTAISIASGGLTATPGTINTLYDNVSTDDKIKVSVTATSTTKPRGLWIVLEFELP